jgi:hypothetical protein
LARPRDGGWIGARPDAGLWAPAARLDVASAAHEQVRAWGLASFVPAHDVRAHDATAVVAANDCTLRQVDHYHVRRVSLDMEPLRRDGPAGRALRDLVANPTDRDRQSAFLRQLERLGGPSPDPGPTTRGMAASPTARIRVNSADVVQRGDGSRLNANTHYHVRETVLPVAELLRGNRDLVESFAAALRPDAAPGQQAAVLRGLLSSAGAVDDLALLQHADGLPRADTSLLSLFGWTRVDRASAVMLGTGNRLETSMRLDRATLRPGTVVRDLDRLGRHVRPAPVDRAEAHPRRTPEPEVRPARTTDRGLPAPAPSTRFPAQAPPIPSREEPGRLPDRPGRIRGISR